MEQQVKNRIAMICYANISSLLATQKHTKEQFIKNVTEKSKQNVKEAQIYSDDFDVQSFTDSKCLIMADKLYSQYHQIH